MNKFIDYLNSLNSASGDNENAIAENIKNDTEQIYDKIQVEQAISKNMAETIINGSPTIFFLTGHAGDGKTSILIQILRKLKVYDGNVGIQPYDTARLNENRKLFYIKDLSEIDEENLLTHFEYAINGARDNNMSSIIISNTGQMLKLLTGHGMSESDVLTYMDQNEGAETEYQGVTLNFINLALYDNSNFVHKFLEKINQEELWSPCLTCGYDHKCHIYFNHQLIDKYMDRVSRFMEYFYRWNYEENNRATIRQIVNHISYGFTGNTTCKQIKNMTSFGRTYNNFANLFFGHKLKKGTVSLDRDTKSIREIGVLNSLNLETIKLNYDYDLVIRGDFSGIAPELQEFAKQLWDQYSYNPSDLHLLHMIKRLYFLFSVDSEEKNQLMYSELYSSMFPVYMKIRTGEFDHRTKNYLKQSIYNALFFLNTGFVPKNNDKLYVTLKQQGERVQNVQFILGYIFRDEIVLTIAKNQNIADGTDSYQLCIQFGEDEPIPMSFGLIKYLNDISKGMIQTQVDPALSQGLEKLKMRMQKNMRKCNSESIVLLVYDGESLKEKKLFVDNGKINYEL